MFRPCRTESKSSRLLRLGRGAATILLAIFLAASARAAGEAGFLEAAAGEAPSHLVPVNRLFGEYNTALHHLLVAKYGSGGFGTMLVLPAFSSEWCVSIYRDPDEDENNATSEDGSRSNAGKKYTAVCAKAASSIWSALGEKELDEDRWKQIQVATQSRPISAELAVAVQRVWARAILLTRYPRKAPRGTTDGAYFRFSVFLGGIGDIEGECHSPEAGILQDLVDVGCALRTLVETQDSAASDHEQRLITRLRNLEAILADAE